MPRPHVFRPAQFTERFMLTAILDGTYPPGSSLPNERSLAENIGVTRPTLRETLQRLAREGWISIRHGKPTRVNDYMMDGGLTILGTLTQFPDLMPRNLVPHLLQVRIVLLPPIAEMAAANRGPELAQKLKEGSALGENAESFSVYDWDVQVFMARHSGNPIYPLILNDFRAVFQNMAMAYFSHEALRNTSRVYYSTLREIILSEQGQVAETVRQTMIESAKLWQQVAAKGGGT